MGKIFKKASASAEREYREKYGDDMVNEYQRQGGVFRALWKPDSEEFKKFNNFFNGATTLAQRDVRESTFASSVNSGEAKRQGLFSNVGGSMFGNRW